MNTFSPSASSSRLRRPHRRVAFTIVELLVVIGIAALLLSILLPTMSRARIESRSAVCKANLRSIYHAGQLWRNNLKEGNNDPVDYWRGSFGRYSGSAEIFSCPEDDVDTGQMETLMFNYVLRVKNGAGQDLGFFLELQEGPWADIHNMTDTSYEVWIEDSRGVADNSRNDIYVTVTKNPDGTFQLSLRRRAGIGYHFDLIDTATGQTIKVNMGDDGQPTALPAVTGYRSSYALNDMADPLFGKSHKVWALDYIKGQPVAYANDDWTKTQFLQNNQVKMARHGGYINVLFGDGSVDGMIPPALTPKNTVNKANLWVP